MPAPPVSRVRSPGSASYCPARCVGRNLRRAQLTYAGIPGGAHQRVDDLPACVCEPSIKEFQYNVRQLSVISQKNWRSAADGLGQLSPLYQRVFGDRWRPTSPRTIVAAVPGQLDVDVDMENRPATCGVVAGRCRGQVQKPPQRTSVGRARRHIQVDRCTVPRSTRMASLRFPSNVGRCRRFQR
jgi:hypothetical protein